jgi:hypothetical protein
MARAVLPRLGYELIGEGQGWLSFRDYRVFPRRVPTALSPPAHDPYVRPIRIPLTKIVSRIGFSHARGGWHPFVETLREYVDNPSLEYEDSTLARVYERYRPSSVHEVLLDHIDTPLQPFASWPPVVNLFRWVWAHNLHSVRRILKESEGAGRDRAWTHFGPHSLAYGKREFARIVGTYDSIREKGWSSEWHGAPLVDGYFLVRGDDYRFVLLQGNHRVAALNVLGHEHLDVSVRRFHPAVVDYAELERWTSAHGGLYSPELVTHLFEMLFTETGLAKARRHGLLRR